MNGLWPDVVSPLVLFGCSFPDVPHTARILRCHAAGACAVGGGATLTDTYSGGAYLFDPGRISGYDVDQLGEYEARILSIVVAARTTANPGANTEKLVYNVIRDELDSLGVVIAGQAYSLHRDLVSGAAADLRRVLLIPGGALPFHPFVPMKQDAARLMHRNRLTVGVQHIAGSTLGTIWCEAEAFLAIYPRPRREAD